MPVGAKAIQDRYVTDVKVKGFQKQDGSWVSFEVFPVYIRSDRMSSVILSPFSLYRYTSFLQRGLTRADMKYIAVMQISLHFT